MASDPFAAYENALAYVPRGEGPPPARRRRKPLPIDLEDMLHRLEKRHPFRVHRIRRDLQWAQRTRSSALHPFRVARLQRDIGWIRSKAASRKAVW